MENVGECDVAAASRPLALYLLVDTRARMEMRRARRADRGFDLPDPSPSLSSAAPASSSTRSSAIASSSRRADLHRVRILPRSATRARPVVLCESSGSTVSSYPDYRIAIVFFTKNTCAIDDREFSRLLARSINSQRFGRECRVLCGSCFERETICRFFFCSFLLFYFKDLRIYLLVFLLGTLFYIEFVSQAK